MARAFLRGLPQSTLKRHYPSRNMVDGLGPHPSEEPPGEDARRGDESSLKPKRVDHALNETGTPYNTILLFREVARLVIVVALTELHAPDGYSLFYRTTQLHKCSRMCCMCLCPPRGNVRRRGGASAPFLPNSSSSRLPPTTYHLLLTTDYTYFLLPTTYKLGLAPFLLHLRVLCV